ncbi:MAG TPA: UDP-N-acetylmuramate--L-alanine ligase [Gammaproteobacteria bacterium]|nr:UDP-N-acetylmuramate--L-alanine ligase [Gammaproteobacteria bacterium]
MRDRVKLVHFVGIGGAGMSGIAEVLLNLGYQVSGSDTQDSTVTRHLQSLGARVHHGHHADVVAGTDVIVVSTAIAVDNPEVLAATKLRIPVVRRAEMLGELMRFQKGIAIAGTHGKTTTTSLVASVLAQGGLDPTIVVGGLVHSIDSHARLGSGDYLVAEADESDGSFVHLFPQIAVVTNIDRDHMASYGGDFERLKQAFMQFLHNLPFYGLAVLCVDDPVLAALASKIRKPILTYGTCAHADIVVSDIHQQGWHTQFSVQRAGKPKLSLQLPMPGRHNVLNAVAAVAVADTLGIADTAITEALVGFEGIDRRFQLRGEIHLALGTVLWVDDYAHHPSELAATLQAARDSWPQQRRVILFQPHRYSRTRDLLDDFSLVLAQETPLLITEVYPAGESPLQGADGRALCRAIRARGQVEPVFVDKLEQAPALLRALLQPDDVLLTLGAGNIASVGVALQHSGEAPL